MEAALFKELSLYNTAVELLGDNKGAKPFCSFEDRVYNIILHCRTDTACDVQTAFNDRLELDQLDLIDLDWDDVWDRVIDAEAAAMRKQQPNSRNNRRPPSEDSPPTDAILMPCLLHGHCGHETTDCKTLRKYPDLPSSAIRILKHNHICVIGYGEQHPEGQCGRPDCKFKHVSPAAAQSIVDQPSQQGIGQQQSLDGSSQGPPAAPMLHSNIRRPAPTLPALPPPDDGNSLFASFGMITYIDDEADC